MDAAELLDISSRNQARRASQPARGASGARTMPGSTIVHKRTSWNPYRCWIAPDGAARRRLPRPSIRVRHHRASGGWACERSCQALRRHQADVTSKRMTTVTTGRTSSSQLVAVALAAITGSQPRPCLSQGALKQLDSNRGPTTVTNGETRFATVRQSEDIFAVSKPIAHSTLGVGDQDDIILRVGCREPNVCEPNATIVAGSSLQGELQSSDCAH